MEMTRAIEKGKHVLRIGVEGIQVKLLSFVYGETSSKSGKKLGEGG